MDPTDGQDLPTDPHSELTSLRRRVQELEGDNEKLRAQLSNCRCPKEVEVEDEKLRPQLPSCAPLKVLLPKQSMSSESRANFDPQKRKHFLELCLREANKHGYKGASLTKNSWERLEKEFNEKWNVSYKHKAFKNQFDYLRSDYSHWRTIVGFSGDGFNGDINTVNWPAEKWDEVLQKHPSAKKFKNKALEDVELLKAIFEGTLVKGDNACSPLSSQPPPMTHLKTDDDILFEDDTEMDGDDTQENNSGTQSTTPDPYIRDVTVNEMPGPPGVDNMIVATQPFEITSRNSEKKRRRSSGGGNSLEKQVEKLVTVIREQVNEEKACRGPSFSEVVEVLKDLKNLEVLDTSRYQQALMIFCECPDMKKAFMEAGDVAEQMQFLELIINRR